jgi:hypothetical protein
MFAAVLVLGEAVRSRRALMLEQERSERLLNVLPAPIAEMALAMQAEVARRTDPSGQPRPSASASIPARWRPTGSPAASR